MKKTRKKTVVKSHYQLLKKEWLKRHKRARLEFHNKHREVLEQVIDKFPAKDKLAHGAIGALMISSVLPTTPAVLDSIPKEPQEQTPEQIEKVDRTVEMLTELKVVVGENARVLTQEEESKVSEILSRYFKANIRHELNGLRLNRSYGMIGAEQHLMRFPGDTMATHLEPDVRNNKMIYSSGMAPGRGAWGYFSKSKAEFDDLSKEREKWYIAVQTFEAPNYNGRLSEYRDFFKFRKMLLVNTKTGQAVVCDIGDAGPAVWTGKHLGGSPEVMYHLGYGQGPRKGPVVYFFIDDPSDTLPLGPVIAK